MVKTEDTEDRNKHEGLCGRSWGSGEPLALDKSISTHCSLWASPGGGCGDEIGLAGSALVPKPLLQSAGSGRAGAGEASAGQGRHISAGQHRGRLQPGNCPSPTGQSHQQGHAVSCHRSLCPLLPCRPASAAGAAQASSAWRKQSKAKQSKAGAAALEEAEGAQLRGDSNSGQLPPSSSTPIAPSPAGKGKGG